MVKLSEQNKTMINLGKKLFKPRMKEGAKYHIQIDPETRELISDPNHPPIFWAGIHRSFWETAGYMWVMSNESTRTPYTVAGNNLLKIPGLETVAKNTGVIVFERPNGKPFSEKKRIKIETQNMLKEHFERGDDVSMFVGGGRAYDGIAKEFGDTGYRAAAEAAKIREILTAEFVTDYRSIRKIELITFINHHMGITGSAQKLKFRDWKNFFEKMDDLYIRVGPPTKINPDDNMNYLRQQAYERAQNLSKILPENAMALARLLTYNNLNLEFENVDEKIKAYKNLDDNLELVLEKLNENKNVCELMGGENLWSKDYVIKQAITPYKIFTQEDKAWSTHFTNFVRNHYENMGLLEKITKS